MKTESFYNKTVLENGLRVISERMPSARSVAVGVWVDVGSRDETPEENGISHFIEHMMFKGTKSRTPQEIAASLESRGGALNAFTSREQTCFHATVLDRDLPLAVEIIADIMTNSRLSSADLEREKSVVIEEIMEVEETPSELIHELFSTGFWRGHPLGQPIMGSAATVRSLNRAKVRRYIDRHYRAGRTIVAAAGNVSHRELLKLIGKHLHFAAGEEGRGRAPEMPEGMALKFHRNKSNQAHFCLGFPGVRFDRAERMSILGLHTYLGAGMSSVLFQKIREDKGIGYSIFTFLDFYRDSGVFGAYLATERKQLARAVAIMLREFRKVRRDRLPSQKVHEIKTQLMGNLALSMESTMTRMNRLGRHEILTGKYRSLEQSLKEMERLTGNDILEMARQVFDQNKMTVTSLGPAREEDLDAINWALQ